MGCILREFSSTPEEIENRMKHVKSLSKATRPLKAFEAEVKAKPVKAKAV
jgi:hypothetical protein